MSLGVLTLPAFVFPALTALAFLALVVALALANGASASSVGSLGAVMLVMLRSLSYGQQFQVSAAIVRTTLPYLAELDGERASQSNQSVLCRDIRRNAGKGRHSRDAGDVDDTPPLGRDHSR